MTLTLETVEKLAPDQASLKAASKLVSVKKWPILQFSEGGSYAWGACQGSGANPYHAAFSHDDHWAKCTCPSRKFPCKHTLALMWLYVEKQGDFSAAALPSWLLDWQSRRRGTTTKPAVTQTPSQPSQGKKSITDLPADKPETVLDEAGKARQAAAAKKRALTTQSALLQAMDELDQWISDQLRLGIAGFIDEITQRCRQIAARMVDLKAAALAGRIDEIPAQIMQLERPEAPMAAITALGKLVAITEAFRQDPQDKELGRLVGTARKREALLRDPQALRVSGVWEVVGTRVSTNRSGLVAAASWLLNTDQEPARFALLLDFYPASTGARQSTFACGERFEAQIVYYPGSVPMRAVIAERSHASSSEQNWPSVSPDIHPLDPFVQAQINAPWTLSMPLLLPPGRIASTENKEYWWCTHDKTHALRLNIATDEVILGLDIEQAVGIWDGSRLDLLTLRTPFGRIELGD